MTEWEDLVPRSRSKFLVLKCLNCGNEQVVFGHATNKIDCNDCGAELVKPSGGKAIIRGEIIAVYE